MASSNTAKRQKQKTKNQRFDLAVFDDMCTCGSVSEYVCILSVHLSVPLCSVSACTHSCNVFLVCCAMYLRARTRMLRAYAVCLYQIVSCIISTDLFVCASVLCVMRTLC